MHWDKLSQTRSKSSTVKLTRLPSFSIDDLIKRAYNQSKETKLFHFLRKEPKFMLNSRIKQNNPLFEKKRIHISSKRQITIPAKYYEALGLTKELDCIYSNGMLILTPVKKDELAFSEEILADLIDQGYAGEKLLSEFKKITHQIRPAIEKMIEEADALAKVSSENYVDPTDAIFGTDELES
ncbi:MAG: AbrB/MazE/SpoVT family DNA-binding domain-containing protein [Acetobacterium sp.]|nr:AbrB/MazE/SpoVT family DNA-binding domain-containing protein [Acetobacterium sp.]